MVIQCFEDELSNVEELLFSLETLFKPSISSFIVKCDDKIYRYKFSLVLGRYRVITL